MNVCDGASRSGVARRFCAFASVRNILQLHLLRAATALAGDIICVLAY
jgi:hypothetical protein